MISFFKDNALLLLLGIGTVFNIIWLLPFRSRLRWNMAGVILFSVLHTVYGVFCVKVFAVLETANMENAGNMSLFGGVFFMPLLYFAAAKATGSKTADVFDISAVCMIFTVMCARVNCIISGCCFGKPLFGHSSLRWPTREMEILFYIVLLVILIRKVRNGESEGRVYPIYMIAYGVFRFLCEWVRNYESAALIHRAHIWAVVSLIIGLSIYYEENNRTNRKGRS